MSTIRLPRAFPILGYETKNYFLLDLDKRVSLEEVRKIGSKIAKKYGFGDFLIVLSSYAKQLMLNLKPLQNYNLIYGKKVPNFDYQQWVLKQLRDSGIIRDVRYVEFREKEGTSTLRVSPKSEHKGCGKVVAYVRITGEDEGIKEYLKLAWVGRKVEKLLAEEFAQESWEEIALLKLH